MTLLLDTCLENYLDYFIVEDGVSVTCKIINVKHRRSPLVQGGLEIPFQVTVTMQYSDINVTAIDECKELVNEYYIEPINEKFPDATNETLDLLKSLSDDEELEITNEDDNDD